MRRRAERRRAKDGFYVEVPAAGDLALWTTGVTADPRMGGDERRVAGGLAQLVRRAVIVDGARPGDPIWITYAELGRAS